MELHGLDHNWPFFQHVQTLQAGSCVLPDVPTFPQKMVLKCIRSSVKVYNSVYKLISALIQVNSGRVSEILYYYLARDTDSHS